MFKNALNRHRVLSSVLLVSAAAGWTGGASAEEVTAYGRETANALQAAQAALAAEMQEATRALNRELKDSVAIELKETVTPRLMLAAAMDGESRG